MKTALTTLPNTFSHNHITCNLINKIKKLQSLQVSVFNSRVGSKNNNMFVQYLFVFHEKNPFEKKKSYLDFFYFWGANLLKPHLGVFRLSILYLNNYNVLLLGKIFAKIFILKTRKYKNRFFRFIRWKNNNLYKDLSEKKLLLKNKVSSLYWNWVCKTALSRKTIKLVNYKKKNFFFLGDALDFGLCSQSSLFVFTTTTNSPFLGTLSRVSRNYFKFFMKRKLKMWRFRRRVWRKKKVSQLIGLNFFYRPSIKNVSEPIQPVLEITVFAPVLVNHVYKLREKVVLRASKRVFRWNRRYKKFKLGYLKRRFSKIFLSVRNKYYNKYKFKLFPKKKISKKLIPYFFRKMTSVTKYTYSSFSLKFYLIYFLLTHLWSNKYSKLLNFLNTYYTTNVYKKHHLINIANTKQWTNLTPVISLPTEVRMAAKLRSRFKESQTYSVFLRQYLGGFFEKFTDRKIFLKIQPRLKIPKTIRFLLSELNFELRPLRKIMGKNFYPKELTLVCWYAMWTKDLGFLMDWIHRTMPRLEISKHKKFIKILKVLFWDYAELFLKANNIKGIKFDIRGKLGVVGNSKKRHYSFNVGLNSFSQKKHRLEYRQGLVNTETGVLGLTLIIAF